MEAMPKIKSSRKAGGKAKHAPLADQILAGESVQPGGREKRRDRGRETEEEEEYVGHRLTRRILQQAREQQEELEAEHGSGDRTAPRKLTTRLGPGAQVGESDDEDEEWPTLEKAAEMVGSGFDEEIVVNPEDERAIEMFMNENPPVR